MTELFKAVEAYVKAAFDALAARVSAVEMTVNNLPSPKMGPEGPRGKDGKDADPAEVARLLAPTIEEKISNVFAGIPTPKDGKDGADGLNGKDGRDGVDGKDGAPGKDGLPGKDGADGLKGLDGAPGKDGRDGVDGKNGVDGKDGKDADTEAIKAWAGAELRSLVAAIPTPKDGKDGAPGKDGIEGKAGRDGVDGKQGKDGDPGRDGKDGKDGRDGRDGKDGSSGRDSTMIDPLPGIDESRSYAAGTWAKSRGGLWLARSQTLGMTGWDCILNGVASVEIEQGGERSFSINVTQSNGQKAMQAFIVPTPLDTGVYDATRKYCKGDGVTYAGSWFIALVDDPQGAPETTKDWRLAVKRGRNGKDAETPKPAPGKLKSGTS